MAGSIMATRCRPAASHQPCMRSRAESAHPALRLRLSRPPKQTRWGKFPKRPINGVSVVTVALPIDLHHPRQLKSCRFSEIVSLGRSHVEYHYHNLMSHWSTELDFKIYSCKRCTAWSRCILDVMENMEQANVISQKPHLVVKFPSRLIFFV